MSQSAITSPRVPAWSMSLEPLPPMPMPAMWTVPLGAREARCAEAAEAVRK
jgi:hypothetical protein